MNKIQQNFWVLFLSVLVFGCNSTGKEQQAVAGDFGWGIEEGFSSIALSAQCPDFMAETMEIISEQMGLTDLMYSKLETGIDSIGVYFGLFDLRGSPGYWSAMSFNNNLTTWTTRVLKTSDSLSFPANTIDLEFNEGANSISVKIIHDTVENVFHYQWLKEGLPNQTAHIIDIELPIQVGKPFPELSVSLLNGDKLSIDELKGKYAVINYWHPSCGPCIAAMPGLNNMMEKYSDDSEIVFLAITVDKPERIEMVLDIIEFDFLQSIGDNSATEVFGSSMPKYVILDPNGIVRYYHSGGSEESYVGIDMVLSDLLLSAY